ncbi:MAG: phosphodiester glycosidase family protein [Candidatus Melainabacteria bacterium]|nr:phosphodiester glycosidase family protein [Candidatus Melainabacteria bacterium]
MSLTQPGLALNLSRASVSTPGVGLHKHGTGFTTLGKKRKATGSHLVTPIIKPGAFTRLPDRQKTLHKIDKQIKNKPIKKQPTNSKPAQFYNVKNTTGRQLAPGVTYKVIKNKMRINLIDIDMSRSPVQMRPIIPSYNFGSLKDVRDHSRDSGAIAAINANYFKKDGVPLGTVMIDGEWVSGPLYDRVALGFTRGGYARIARLGLHGVLHTSIPGHETIWINNINQPRRTGSRCILYTRRWGAKVSLPYDGTLIAIDAQGRVVDKALKQIAIPYGGMVVADSKRSAIGALSVGDQVKATWQTTPGNWQNIHQAISGGPILIQNGKIAFDLKSEHFPSNWTGSQITRRTACGITADDHLLMATFEGPHTLYDVAKFFVSQNCIEAMNLDGGGSTTMVVEGNTVTANASAAQRHVAVALGVFKAERAQALAEQNASTYKPQGDGDSLSAFDAATNEVAALSDKAGVIDTEPLSGADCQVVDSGKGLSSPDLISQSLKAESPQKDSPKLSPKRLFKGLFNRQ